MKILLTGAHGQVGREVARLGAGRGHTVLALTRADLDITDAAAVDRMVAGSGADAVINAAAYTAVDRAEDEPGRASAVNRDGPAHLAARCRALDIPLLHLSTDYVFDGRKAGPYVEDDPAAPLGVYGRSKWEGEEAVRRCLSRHLILRVSWVFGAHGHNFVATMLRLGRERDALRVVADQYGGPTWAGHIAGALLDLALRAPDLPEAAWGTYHYCGAPATTWHGFAEAIFERAVDHGLLARAPAVAAIATADYPTPAPRPANSVLDCGRIGARLGIETPDWAEGLESVLREWKERKA